MGHHMWMVAVAALAVSYFGPASGYNTTQHGNRTYIHHKGIVKSPSSGHYMMANYNVSFVDNVFNLDTDTTVQSTTCDDITNTVHIQYTGHRNSHNYMQSGVILHGGVVHGCVNTHGQPTPFYYSIVRVQYDSKQHTATLAVQATNFFAVIEHGSFNFTILNSSVGQLVAQGNDATLSNHTQQRSMHLMDVTPVGSINYDPNTGKDLVSYTIYDQTCTNADCSSGSTDAFCMACAGGDQPEISVICNDCWLQYAMDFGDFTGSVGMVGIQPNPLASNFNLFGTPTIQLTFSISGTLDINLDIAAQIDDLSDNSGTDALISNVPIGNSVSASLGPFSFNLGAFMSLNKYHDLEVQSKGEVEFSTYAAVQFGLYASCTINPNNIFAPDQWCQHTQFIQHTPISINDTGVSLDANVTIEHGLVPVISADLGSLVTASISAIAYVRAEIDFQYPAFSALTYGYYDPAYGQSYFMYGDCSTPHYIQYAVVGGVNQASAQYGYDIPVPSILSYLAGTSALTGGNTYPINSVSVDIPIVSGCLFGAPAVAGVAATVTTFTVTIVADAADNIADLAYNLGSDLAKACGAPQYRLHFVSVSPTVSNSSGVNTNGHAFHIDAAQTSTATFTVLPSSDGTGPSVAQLSTTVQSQLHTYNSNFYQISSGYIVAPPAPTAAPTVSPTSNNNNNNNGGNSVDAASQTSTSSSISSGSTLYIIIGGGAGGAVLVAVVVAVWVRHCRRQASKGSQVEHSAAVPDWQNAAWHQPSAHTSPLRIMTAQQYVNNGVATQQSALLPIGHNVTQPAYPPMIMPRPMTGWQQPAMTQQEVMMAHAEQAGATPGSVLKKRLSSRRSSAIGDINVHHVA